MPFIQPQKLRAIADRLIGTQDNLNEVLLEMSLVLDEYQKTLIPAARCRQCRFWMRNMAWYNACPTCGFVNIYASNEPNPDWEKDKNNA